ncbi:epoxyqueuosine reductase [bacterium]|nr:MAG: epoxyqueuosine reductase [bacterium]
MKVKENLIKVIEKFVEEHPGNVGEDGGRYFDTPLVGFASARDHLFEEYKKIIGPFHWTPAEVLNEGVSNEGSLDGTVVSWILPITESVRLSNRAEDRFPSRQWAHTRNFGEMFNDEVRKMAVVFLTEHGGQAFAPMLMKDWKRVDDTHIGWASTWSERHAAYAAGLGTFSINDGLITPRGIAHRCGSVVTDIVMDPTARLYKNYRENCLLCRGERCGICILRCPVGAISEDGHDKDLCNRYTYSGQFKTLAKKYEAKHIGCGLCQTDVPCENRIPEIVG